MVKVIKPSTKNQDTTELPKAAPESDSVVEDLKDVLEPEAEKPEEKEQKAEKPEVDEPELVTVSAKSVPGAAGMRKRKVKSLVNDRGQYGALRFALVKGEMYEFNEEIAKWMISTNRCVG